ncbi:hypothetical protein BKA66DRAFT_568849 [Pyrenochaeta sp. MPI-SDFR-AT-0127]|nr:hypothetical protein BKA66DRAFT_568849 [Pyrenochaeta sp. MPI-SDFR-AT-0127]
MPVELKRKASLPSLSRKPASPKRTCIAAKRASLDSIYYGLDTEQCSQLKNLRGQARKLTVENQRIKKEIDENDTSLNQLFRDYCFGESHSYGFVGAGIIEREVQRFDALTLAEKEEYEERSSKIVDLRRELQHNDERLDALTRDCAALQNPHLTAMIQARLPREIRDQIYDHLWTVDDVEKLDSVISSEYAPHWLSSNDIASLILPVPFFVNPLFVGCSFADDASVWYFRMRSRAEIKYHHVRGFLERNSFGFMPFIPRDIIRRLTINIEWAVGDRVELAYAALRDSMNSLLLLQDREDLDIHIYLSRDLQFSQTLFHVLEIIKPVIHMFERKGPKIKVMGYQFFTPAWRDHLDPIPKETFATVELLNYYFKGTPEEWLSMKNKELLAITQLQRKDMCLAILDKMRDNLRIMNTSISRLLKPT